MKPYSENKKLKVIEMVAGPGAGKSTAAHFLAGHMGARGYKVEYVREIPKDLVWDERGNIDPNHSLFTEQDYILALQNNLFRRMLNHDIDYVVTDTSLLLGLIHMPTWLPPSFTQFLLDVHDSYDNITFYIDRGDIPYVQTGRNEDYVTALAKDRQAMEIISTYCDDFHLVQQKAGIYDHAALQMLHVIEKQRSV